MIVFLEALLVISIWVWAVVSPFIVLVTTVMVTIDYYTIYESIFLAAFGGFVGSIVSTIVLLLIGFALGWMFNKILQEKEKEKYGD